MKMNMMYECVCNLKVGDFVYGWNEKRPYKVLYVDDRYTLIAKQQFGNYMYSVIDKKFKIMGRCDKYQLGMYVPREFFKVGLIDEPFKKYIEVEEGRYEDKERATIILNWTDVSIFDEKVNLHL